MINTSMDEWAEEEADREESRKCEHCSGSGRCDSCDGSGFCDCCSQSCPDCDKGECSNCEGTGVLD